MGAEGACGGGGAAPPSARAARVQIPRRRSRHPTAALLLPLPSLHPAPPHPPHVPGKALRAELAKMTGRSSVPNIWIAGQNVGGCSEGPGVVPLQVGRGQGLRSCGGRAAAGAATQLAAAQILGPSADPWSTCRTCLPHAVSTGQGRADPDAQGGGRAVRRRASAAAARCRPAGSRPCVAQFNSLGMLFCNRITIGTALLCCRHAFAAHRRRSAQRPPPSARVLLSSRRWRRGRQPAVEEASESSASSPSL